VAAILQALFVVTSLINVVAADVKNSEVVQGHAPLFPFSFIARIVKLLNYIIHLTIASFYSFVIFYTSFLNFCCPTGKFNWSRCG
jgi:hypothetical protein